MTPTRRAGSTIGGRISTRCHTCRRRKVKCDERRPECEQCVKSGNRCEGYENYNVFVNIQPNGRRQVVLHAQNSPNVGDDAVPRPPIARLPHYQSSVPVIAPIIRSIQVANEQLFANFISEYLPDRALNHPQWLRLALALPNRSDALDWALKALSLSRLGWKFKSKFFTYKSMAAYEQALQKLQLALNDPYLSRTDQTLAAIRTSYVYEIFESASMSLNGWEAHHVGTLAVVRLRGPHDYATPLGRALLEDIRNSTTVYNIHKRQTSFLGDRQWREDPWLETGKDFEQQLYDLGLDLNIIWREIDAISRNDLAYSLEAVLRSCTDRCHALERALSVWLISLCGSQALPWEDDEGHMNFASLRLGLAYMFSWCLQLNLCSAKGFLQARAKGPQMAQSWLSSASEDVNSCDSHGRSHELATSILKATPFCMRQEWGFYGPQKSLFALKAAYLHFQLHNCRGVERCREIYSEIIEEKGLSFYGKYWNHKAVAKWQMPNTVDS